MKKPTELITDNLARLVNLPDWLRFFPTRVTDTAKVKELFSRLWPVKCDLIRLGPEADGGYLVPNDLDGIGACFSPGVGNESGFELECAKRGMLIYMADASVDGPAQQHPNFRFVKKFIGPKTHGDFISLQDWVTWETSDLLMQMDIEGGEYEALLGVTSLSHFRIIVIELHYLDYLLSAPIFPLYKMAIDRLLENHTCVHIHANNVCPPIQLKDFRLPQIAEFTFLRNDRIGKREPVESLVHPLDRDNFAY